VLDTLTLVNPGGDLISWTTVFATPDTVRFEQSTDNVNWIFFSAFPWDDGTEVFDPGAFYRARALVGAAFVTSLSNVIHLV
jgi:hypothetical protein